MKINTKYIIIISVITLTLITAVVYFSLYEKEYNVLFDDINTSDVKGAVELLDKEGVDYKIDHADGKLMIEKGKYNEVRSGLLLNEIGTVNGVGFELFDNSDIGMTEFAQKINHQRALQGELAKTIMSFPEIKYARVHLVLPEKKFFSKKKSDTKASISVFINENMSLSDHQVDGIKHLVAASVPDLEKSNVVVNDQNGYVLGKNMADDVFDGMSSLELKQKIEQYFVSKVTPILEYIYGPGQTIVAIDVSLQLDNIESTQEKLLTNGNDQSGILTRKRESLTQNNAPYDTSEFDLSSSDTTTNKVIELEYEYGKKLETVVIKPGDIKRLSIGVFLPGLEDPEAQNSVQNVISMAVGLNPDRGDSIKIHFAGHLSQVKEMYFFNEANLEKDLKISNMAGLVDGNGGLSEKVSQQQEQQAVNTQVADGAYINEEITEQSAFDMNMNSDFMPIALLAFLFLGAIYFYKDRFMVREKSNLNTDRQEAYELIYKWLDAK